VHFGTSIQKYEEYLFNYHQLSCSSAQATGLCFNNLGIRGSSDFVFAVAHKSALRARSKSRYPIPSNFIGRPKIYNVALGIIPRLVFLDSQNYSSVLIKADLNVLACP
jgi:hypothetical protein